MLFCAVIIVVLLSLVMFLSARLLLLRSAVREVADELDEKLKNDTNTLISVSSGDRNIRALAARLNNQLKLLRAERLRLRNGVNELKNSVTGISHDLRTPLTAVCGYLELLKREELSENVKRYLAVINERTEAMRGLTEELFRYSVAVDAADSQDCTDVCLNDVLEESLAGFYGVLSGRKITPEILIPEKKVVRRADRIALRRIFDNVIGNAARYSDGDLSVTMTENGVIRFENSAKGLDLVQTERLFDRFYTVRTASGSTGLGLSIARLLTEKNGGHAEAEYLSGRLRITVSFPEK